MIYTILWSYNLYLTHMTIFRESGGFKIKNVYTIKIIGSPCQISKCRHLVEKQQKLFSSRVKSKSPATVSNAEKKATKSVLECSLKPENCLQEFKKNVKRLLTLAEQKSVKDNDRLSIEKVKHIKQSLKKDMLKVDDYAWCFKFLYNFDLY